MESLATTEDETDTMTSLTEVLSTIQTGKIVFNISVYQKIKSRVLLQTKMSDKRQSSSI